MIGNRYEYDAMAACEQEMWWYRCLHDLTLQKIKQYTGIADPQVLDAGCGTGGLLLQLKDNGYDHLTGFDLSPDAVEYARECSGIAVQTADITSLQEQYPENYFDVVTSHDIVCLLQKGKDKTALIQLLRVLKPGGLLLMNFPALKAFNGTHDRAVGIQQRYSKKTIRKLVSGLAEIRELSYWPFILSPAIFIIRSMQKIGSAFIKKEKPVSDVKMPPRFLNRIFYGLTSLENKMIPGKPWGSSLFLVLQKPV